ncbi:hypothetical protein HK405_008394, partial [Cladochytrium tenue]
DSVDRSSLRSHSSSAASATLLLTASAQHLAAALVREYLSSRGLTKTLEAFRLELPTVTTADLPAGLQQASLPVVSTRSELAKQLGIAKILQQNKAQEHPFKTHLEAIVRSLIARRSGVAGGASTDPAASSTAEKPNSARRSSRSDLSSVWKDSSPAATPDPTAFPVDRSGKKPGPATSSATVAAGTASAPSPSAPNRPRAFDMHLSSADPATTHSLAARDILRDLKKATPLPDHATALLSSNSSTRTSTSSGATASITDAWTPKPAAAFSQPTPQPAANSTPPRAVHVAALDLEDFDPDLDFDDDERGPVAAPTDAAGDPLVVRLGAAHLGQSRGAQIAPAVARALRAVVFAPPPLTVVFAPPPLTSATATSAADEDIARARSSFPDEWRGHGFVFNTSRPDLAYGLVQTKGGPCGLLAAVQAYVIKHLVYTNSSTALKDGRLRPTASNCRRALVAAITEILWNAGGPGSDRAVVAIYNDSARPVPPTFGRDRYVPDGITEKMEVYEIGNEPGLRAFVESRIDSFAIKTLTSAAALSSVAMGIALSSLQELVNLLLLGRAVSNVHDGDIVLGDDGEGQDRKILKGIKEPCQFGYLTLFEHYGSIKVGSRLKNPQLPIYVVCSESHFSILFALQPSPGSAQPLSRSSASSPSLHPFDLFYYDGLAGQDAEIRLTLMPVPAAGTGRLREVATRQVGGGKEAIKDGLAPPLELVLRTRWPDVHVSWNGTDPLL